MNSFSKILLLILLYYPSIYPQDTLLLQNRINSLLSNNSYFDRTLIAADVYDLTSLKSIYSLNNKLLLRPASNMKLLSSAAGIYFLKDYSFTTSLLYTGEIINNTLLGDLYIRGGCDPAFSVADLDSLILNLRAYGIHEITGLIYADISFKDEMYWGNGWMWDDDPSADAPYLSALNINFNVVRIVAAFEPETDSLILRTEPPSSYFTLDNRLVINKDNARDSLYVTRDWIHKNNNIRISGSLNSGDRTERFNTLNVFSPVDYFMTLFRERLNHHLVLSGGEYSVKKTPDYASEIYSLKRSLDSVLNFINKSSNNLAAEMVLYALAERYYGKPASARNGLMLIDSLIRIIGMNPSDYRLADGSGVSHYNLLSAELLLSLLKYFYYRQPELYAKLYNSLSIAGRDGTLRNRMKGTQAEGNIRGKTGTLSAVSCLSGYVNSRSGNQLAVSILVQNFAGDPGYARYIQDEICRILAEY